MGVLFYGYVVQLAPNTIYKFFIVSVLANVFVLYVKKMFYGTYASNKFLFADDSSILLHQH